MSDSLWPHRLQHARLPYPSPTPGAYSHSCLSSRWYHPTISSSVIPFSSCLQSFPASSSFPMSQFFTSGGQTIRVSAWASILPMNIKYWFPLGWIDWISLQSKGLSRVFFKPQFKTINSLLLSFLYSTTLISIMTTGKTIALTRWTFLVMSLLFHMLSRLVIALLSRSKCLLISWPQSPPAVILEPRKRNSVTVSIVSPSLCLEVMPAVLCQTLCDPLDCSPPGSSVHGILQARILEWVAGDLPDPRIEPVSPVLVGRFFTTEPPERPYC